MIGAVLAARYEILELIGEGGMGRVYAGTQRVLERPVAIKCIHPRLLANEPMLIRFMEEARIASRFVHPNVVKIYDFGKTEPPLPSTFFLVMERLFGPDLASVIQERGALPVGRAHGILRQLLSALGEAHALGITHRDAKPDNIILEASQDGRDHVKIIDFGIARVHGVPGVTTTGQFVGTPQYMSPEQVRGERAEVTADLYSSGILLFQMLTGELPFNAPTIAEVLDQQLHARRPDPREYCPDCPASLAQVCLTAIDVDARRRFPSAEAFAEALDRAMVGEVSPPRRFSPAPRVSDIRSLAPDTERSRSRRETETVSASREVWGEPDFLEAEALERAADAEISAGRTDAAERLLREGVELGRRWLGVSETVLGEAAVATFGRKLGAVLRDRGDAAESERVLVEALRCSIARDVERARVLTELVATLADLGEFANAERYRIEALRIATEVNDRDLVVRLRRLAQSLAFTIAAPRSGSAPPRRSEQRRALAALPEVDSDEEEPARRRRS